MPRLKLIDRSELEGYLARQIAALPGGSGEVYGMDPGDHEYSRSYGIDWSVVITQGGHGIVWEFMLNDEPVVSGHATTEKAAIREIVDQYERHVVRENPPMSSSKTVRVPYTLVRADWEPNFGHWSAGVATIEAPASFITQGSLVLFEWNSRLRGMIGGSDAIYDIVEDETLRSSDTAKVRAILKRGAKENLTGYAGTVIAGMFSIAALNGKVIGGYGPTKATVETESIYVRPGCHPLGQLPVGAWRYGGRPVWYNAGDIKRLARFVGLRVKQEARR